MPDDSLHSFSAAVAEETVCYTSLMNTRVAVVVPADAPPDDLDDVMDQSRGHGLVCTRVGQLDGAAFDVELEFTPVDAVAFGEPDT